MCGSDGGDKKYRSLVQMSAVLRFLNRVENLRMKSQGSFFDSCSHARGEKMRNTDQAYGFAGEFGRIAVVVRKLDGVQGTVM